MLAPLSNTLLYIVYNVCYTNTIYKVIINKSKSSGEEVRREEERIHLYIFTQFWISSLHQRLLEVHQPSIPIGICSLE